MTTLRTSATVALLLSIAGGVSAADLAGRLDVQSPYVHDPSRIIKHKGQYWLFSTGNGIKSCRSRDMKRWETGPAVFAVPPAWTSNVVAGFSGHFWAPDVLETGHRFLLYYSVSAWGKKTSAIGLVTNPTLDPSDPRYHWTDHGMVVQSGAQDDFNAIDPAVAKDAGNNLWLVFGSFWSGIKMIQLDPVTGERMGRGSPIFSLAHHTSIEAASLHRHGEYYYLFVNWGQCCRGTNSTYEIRVGRSAAITGPYLDQAGLDLLQGGGMLVLNTTGTLIGPGHASIMSENGSDYLGFHFYDPARRGRPGLAILPLRWDTNGWPAPGATKPVP